MAEKIIAITGGIGAGKSVVSQMLRVMGYDVYDCDSNAKAIMDNDNWIKAQLQAEFGEDVIVNGSINRPKLSAIVFSDKNKLAQLNSLVHRRVIEDILDTAKRANNRLFFVESAIVYGSGINKISDEVWQVDAPQEVRVGRVMKRNAMTEAQVVARINSQKEEFTNNPDFVIKNDGKTAILPILITHINRLTK